MGWLRGIILGASIIFVIIFAIGVGFVDGVAEKFEPLLCAPGERVQVDRWHDSHGGNSANVYCVGENGKQISWRSWVLIFVPIPLALGLMALLGGLRGSKSNSRPTVSFGSVTLDGTAGTPVIVGRSVGKKTLADRLRELDEAYQAGLISKEEFDRARQQILDSQADD
jgi:hypothetical protein